MKRQISIWDLIDSKKEPEAVKSPCFPVPFDVIAVVKPAIGGNKRGIIPCVRLKRINGDGYELRRCENILKPCAGESIDLYLKRLEDELCRRDILGEVIL